MVEEFIRAKSIDHAVSLAQDSYVFLAGGTQVNSAPFRKWGSSVKKVVSLDFLDLAGIRQEEGKVCIGATTTLQDIADSLFVPEALRAAAAFIPTRSVRNIATIGGNIGANRWDSYIIPVLLAMGAIVKKADDSFLSVESYVNEENDALILEIIIPPVRGCCVAVKESRSHVAPPVVSAAVRLAAEGGKISESAIYASCIGSHVMKLTQVEDAVLNAADVERAVWDSIHPPTDTLGSSEFKKYLNAVKIADAVELCRQEIFS